VEIGYLHAAGTVNAPFFSAVLFYLTHMLRKFVNRRHLISSLHPQLISIGSTDIVVLKIIY